MQSQRQGYLKELARIRSEINRLFESALLAAGLEAGGGPPGVWLPAVDAIEDDRAYCFYVELPGVKPERVTCRAEAGLLEISGERPLPLDSGESFRQLESRYGPFRRTVSLRPDADPARLEKRFERGVLRVRVPKGAA
jgi:HSP20 family protein